MGLLSLFSKPRPGVRLLPSGTMTVDRNARIVASTVSSAHSTELLEEIGNHILHLFREAHKAHIPLSEMTMQFASLKINAREMRGGAIIFLSPTHSYNVPP
jgi:hypothetical protein